jgi:polyhydroxyalkanoate synthesis regulator phasin
VTDALRVAVERTLAASAGSAAAARGRAGDLLDEIARRGREAREQLARRGQEAGTGLARRSQDARGELTRRLELLERRLAAIEEALREQTKPKAED